MLRAKKRKDRFFWRNRQSKSIKNEKKQTNRPTEVKNFHVTTIVQLNQGVCETINFWRILGRLEKIDQHRKVRFKNQDACKEVLFATKKHELPFSHKDFKWLPESSISFIAPKTEICKVPCHVLLHNSPIRLSWKSTP